MVGQEDGSPSSCLHVQFLITDRTW